MRLEVSLEKVVMALKKHGDFAVATIATALDAAIRGSRRSESSS